MNAQVSMPVQGVRVPFASSSLIPSMVPITTTRPANHLPKHVGCSPQPTCRLVGSVKSRILRQHFNECPLRADPFTDPARGGGGCWAASRTGDLGVGRCKWRKKTESNPETSSIFLSSKRVRVE